MFCDLVGSTSLANSFDPEDLKDIVRSYQEVGVAAVESVGGHVAQYLGDGLLVYFGWPLAHEDDAPRAVRAGLRILEGLTELNVRLRALYKVNLQARIGIHTGSTVVGEMGTGPSREVLALGVTPNIAARIQGMAEPDTVCISEATGSLIEGLFDVEEAGPFDIRGRPEQMHLIRVLKERRGTRRFSIAESRGLTPLVARYTERDMLREGWTRACAGQRVSVLLRGDAGIGKSRLVHYVEELARDQAQLMLYAQCSSLTRNTALTPIAAALRSAWTDPDRARDSVAALFGEQANTAWPLLADLAGFPCPEELRANVRGWTSQRLRRGTLNAVARYIERSARSGPVLFVVEDLHWADPSTLELIELVSEQRGKGGAFNLFTARGETRALAGSTSTVEVRPLSLSDSQELVQRTARGFTLPRAVAEHLAKRTDGNPLYIEEVTKAIIHLGLLHKDERGELQLVDATNVPTTLYGSLMARIDVLGPARKLLQMAALIGREVDLDLLDSACGLSKRELAAQLRRLLQAELLFRNSERNVSFRHTLVRDAAAKTLVSTARRSMERRIAGALIERFPERAQVEPERVAHHLTEAGESREAISWWRRAALAAIQHSANQEAIAHLRGALRLVDELAEGPEKLAEELSLRALLGVPLTLTRGWAHPDVGATYERADELCAAIGEAPELMPTRIGLTTYYIVRGRFRRAQEMAYENLRVADASGDAGLMLEAEHDCGTTSLYLGQFERALHHLERVQTLYDPNTHHGHAWLYGKDPMPVALVHRAMILVCIGRVDSALDAAREAVAHTERWPHPFTYLWALIGLAITHTMRGEHEAAAQVAVTIAEQAEAQGFPNWLAQALIYMGLGDVIRGDHEPGIERIERGLQLWTSTGAELGMPVLGCLLARALLVAGRADQAQAALQRALQSMEETEERWAEPEALRLWGDIEYVRAGADAALPLYRLSLDKARAAGSRTFELAAAVALASIMTDRGESAAARALLRPALEAMPEGRDFPHAVRATTILSTLDEARS